nr:N-6 DNA methylase [Polyangium spumosum]
MPYLEPHGLFAPTYFARVVADPRGTCPRTQPVDIDTRLAALVEIWGRYRPSLTMPAPSQKGLFTDTAETKHVGLPRDLRPLPKSQEAVAEGFVQLVLEKVCGYHADPKPPLLDPATQEKHIPDFVCFASQEAAVRLRSGRKMPEARVYCADALLVVDAKRFGKGVGADEAGDEQSRAKGPKAARKEPTASEDVEQVLRYLRVTGKRWGVLTNGRSWRLMEAGKFEAHLRFDLVLFAEDLLARGGVFTDEDRAALTLFLHLFGPPATSGYLDMLARESEVETRRVREILRERAHEAVSIVANGFLLHPGNGFVAREGSALSAPTQEKLDELRELSLVFLYRLLFVLKAEAMNLLPMRDRNGAKTSYAKHASTEAIFHAVARLSAHERTESSAAYKMLRDLFQLIDKGGEYDVLAYNGGLFSAGDHPDLEELRLRDDVVHALLVSLIYLDADTSGVRAGEPLVAVPYADLDVRDLGDVYEGLLELRLVRDPQVPLDGVGVRPFVLRNQDGEKKASGSYFTPDVIVEHLVRRALQPLLDACGTDAEAVLSLKVVDPAMGSGHFLVKAIDVIAWHLTLRCDPLEQGVANDNGPRELAYWKRRVVERCIYGVDVNPMAVELAKVALWLHTASAGKPLSFLDHHLKCGNALVGARLGRLNVPARVARRTKKGDVWEPRPTGEAQGKGKAKGKGEGPAEQAPAQRPLALSLDEGWMKDIVARVAQVAAQPANTVAEVHDKIRRHQDVDARLRCHRLLADLWCAQWFLAAPDVEGVHVYQRGEGLYEELREACVRSGSDGDELRRMTIEKVADVPLVKEIARVREEGYGPRLLRFFHWELEFPEIAFDATGARRPRVGFDAVVGNPPWNKLKPAKRDFYGPFSDEVANTQGPSLDRLIDRLQGERPELASGWDTYTNRIETLVEYLAEGGDYEHQSVEVNGKKTGGDPDLFRYFIERAHQLARVDGRIGQVVPSTLWQAEGCTGLRRLLLETCTMGCLYGFENARRWAFSIHSQFKFSTFVVARRPASEGHKFPAAFMLRDARVLEGGLQERVVEMSRAFVDAVSPGTLALLDVKNELEAKLIERLHEEHPALGSEKSGWGVKYRNELHMTNDAWMFRNRAWMKARGFTQVMPVRDTQGQWTQRFEGPGEVAELPEALPAGGEYWVAASERYYRNRGYAERSGEMNGQTVAWFIHPSDVGKDEDKSRIFAGERYTALYDGRLIHSFDHCYQRYVSGEGPKQIWARLDLGVKKYEPRVFTCRVESAAPLQARCGFRDIARGTDERTMIAAIVPGDVTCGNKVPVLRSTHDDVVNVLPGILGSLTADFIIRLRVGATLNWIYVARLIVPRREEIDSTSLERLRVLVARLSCTTPEMADVWTHVFPDEPWSYDSAERDPWKRAELRAEIDAIVADLYGLSVPEYAYVLTTFPLLDRDQPPLPGDGFVTEGKEASRGSDDERGVTWDETEDGIVEITPRSFITRDLALLRYMQRKGYPIPADLDAFYRDVVGLDPRGPLSRFRVGALRDLEARVIEAKKRGAVAYVPSGRGGGQDEETS